jgi:hypothetical protein
MIYNEWQKYYTMQKTIQPQVFLRNLEMLANISFTFSFDDTSYTQDFTVDNGIFLMLSRTNIKLNIG